MYCSNLKQTEVGPGWFALTQCPGKATLQGLQYSKFTQFKLDVNVQFCL